MTMSCFSTSQVFQGLIGAIIIVMLFSLPHHLPGQVLVDLVKALLPNGHKFVSSTYILKKYFADLFREPPPNKCSYCAVFNLEIYVEVVHMSHKAF